jgi:flagellar hook-length control protein FliK
MNATPMTITPGNAAQAVPQAGKQADSGAPDMPFSQVLSGEIAQARKNEPPRESSDAGTRTEPASRSVGKAAGKTDSAQQAKAETKAGEKAAHDKDEKAPADEAAVAPETLLALAINPDAFKPVAAPADTRPAPADQASAIAAATAASVLDSRKGHAIPVAPAAGPVVDKPGIPTAQQAGGNRSMQAMQAMHRAGDDQVAQKSDPRLSGKEELPALAARTATPAETAVAFQEQLAAARHADSAKAGETLPDLAGPAAMRAAPHLAVDAGLVATDAASPRLAPTVGTAAWGHALGEKMVWMAAGNQQTASLTLNPPDLGPLQIVVNVSNDQATASFFSAQPEVRHALEAAFPRLREMMNDAGIQLGQATVSADTPQQQNSTPDRQAQRLAPPFPGADPGAPAALQTVQAPIRHSGRGLVDTFA